MSLRRRLLGRLRRHAAPPPAPRPPAPPPPGLSDYRLSDPGLAVFTEDDLHPALRAALSGGRPGDALREVHPDLFAARLVTEAWCDRLRAEVDAFEAWVDRTGCDYEPPNSMNRYGVVLDRIGLRDALDGLMRRAVAPLAARAFPEVGGDSLDDHHGFIVAYQARGGDRDLGFHVDDSEVTLNLCLGGGFVGGDLYFEGRRCALHRQTGCSEEDRFDWMHQPGVALLHAGKHRHGARPILEGRRRNLILWCRSGTYRGAIGVEEATCPDWCQRSQSR